MVDIITLSLPPHPANLRYRQLIALGRVSKRWQQIVNYTPSLWSLVDLDDRPASVVALLSKSQNHPLDLHCSGAKSLSRTHNLSVLGRCTDRWRSLVFTQVPGIVDLRPFLGNAAPMLEALHLERANPRLSYPPLNVDLFNGQAPRLRSLTLIGLCIPWDSTVLHQLHHFEITCLGDSQPPLRKQILDILRHCPSLKALILFYSPKPAQEEDGLLDAVTSTAPITLLDLVKLEFHIPFHHLEILPLFIAPKCFDINIIMEGPPADANITDFVSPFLPAIRTRLKNRGSIRLVLGDHSVVCNDRIPGADPSIHIVLSRLNTMDEPLRWLVENLSPELSSSGLPVAFHLRGRFDFTWHDITAAAWGLQSTTSIHTEDGVENVDHLISLLASPHIEDGVARWPMPALRDLTIEGSADAEEVLRMVESRYGWTRSWAEGEVDPQYPRHFDILHVGSLRGTILEDVEAIVGVGKVNGAELDSDDTDYSSLDAY